MRCFFPSVGAEGDSSHTAWYMSFFSRGGLKQIRRGTMAPCSRRPVLQDLAWLCVPISVGGLRPSCMLSKRFVHCSCVVRFPLLFTSWFPVVTHGFQKHPPLADGGNERWNEPGNSLKKDTSSGMVYASLTACRTSKPMASLDRASPPAVPPGRAPAPAAAPGAWAAAASGAEPPGPPGPRGCRPSRPWIALLQGLSK